MEIKFDTTVNFLGRNGYFKADGVHIDGKYDKLFILPITSKGKFGTCTIEIPKKNLKEFIEGLKTFL